MLIGNSFNENFLSVAGGRFATPESTDTSAKAFIDTNTAALEYPTWAWARPNENVTEDADFYAMKPGANARPERLVMDDKTTGFTRPENVQEDFSDWPSNDANQHSHTSIALRNGWAGVTWGFYGEILQRLAANEWNKFGLRKYFYFPTYAFGYNWTKSNRGSGVELAKYISAVILAEQAGGRLCHNVILVTHSMGGLVARACSELAGGNKQILGIVHGAQPAVGTPSAYHQFRAGADFVPLSVRKIFDVENWKNKAKANIIGSGSDTIDPIFGHSPGPCELLPSPAYRTNRSNKLHSNSAEWLYVKGPGNPAPLPGGKPVFDAVYDSANFPGFQENASQTLADQNDDQKTGYERTVGPGDALRKTMTIAKTFHTDMDGKLHPVTYYSYSYDMADKTYDEIDYVYLRPKKADSDIPTHNRVVVERDPLGDEPDVNLDTKNNNYYRIQPKAGSGDGTVAASSATSLGSPGGLRPAQFKESTGSTPDLPAEKNAKVVRIRAVRGLEHSQLYVNEEITAFTLLAVSEIASNYCLKKIGKAKKPLWTP